MKTTDEMTLEELIEWATGHVLIEIGRGEFRSAMRLAMREAYAAGHRVKSRPKQTQKNGKAENEKEKIANTRG